jgi:hypothetical protein
MIFCNGFVGCKFQSQTVEFCSSDTKDKFLENLKSQPEDWYYRTTPIEYKYNENGHRSKEIKDLDFDNYILYTGCSHTEGIGIELDKTYPYLFSKMLEKDYYNLAVEGTGIDVVEYNLLTWFAKFTKKPKLVVIQWPDHSRFLSKYPGYENFIPEGTWAKDKNFEKFFAASDITGFYNARKNISYRLIHNVIDVPIIGVYLSSLATYDNKSVRVRRYDKARDLQHSGIVTNADIANRILDYYKTMNSGIVTNADIANRMLVDYYKIRH